MSIDLKFHKPSHLKIAEDYINIGNALSDLGRTNEALKTYHKGLAIILKFFGPRANSVFGSFILPVVFFFIIKFKYIVYLLQLKDIYSRQKRWISW
jgi:tetratricopeptide (TPR) repeat protein